MSNNCYEKLIKAFDKRIASSDPKSSREILKSAGIIDKKGNIAKEYAYNNAAIKK